MASSTGRPPWTRESLEAALADHGGNPEALARAIGVSGSTIRTHMQRRGIVGKDARVQNVGGAIPTGLNVSGAEATAVLPEGADLSDLDALLRKRGLDPADWVVERVTTNEWEALAYGGGPDGEPRVVTLHQLKAFLVHRSGSIRPAMEVERRPPPVPLKRAKGEPELVVVMGDQQAPYHDEDLHASVLRWLADVHPSRGVLTGDTLDLPTVSRHQDRLRWSASVQECVDTGYRLLSDYRDAEPNVPWVKLRGNHDWRLESELMGRAERMAFITPAAIPGEELEPHLYSIKRLLHLDALGIELSGVEGEDWRYGEVSLGPSVVVRHEPPSQLKATRLNRSVLAGHTHRQSIRKWTTYDESFNPRVHTLVEVGCLARTREGLGYAPDADWQAGFATVTIHPDGAASYDLATWRDGVLTWRGDRW